MNKVALTDHEVLLIFAALESIWWDADDTKKAEKLERKLRKAIVMNPRLSAWVAEHYPSMEEINA